MIEMDQRSNNDGSPTSEQSAEQLDFCFQDTQHHQFLLEKLNTFRKNRQFCDLTLQFGSGQEFHELYAHAGVLAGASGYFLEAFSSANFSTSGVHQSPPSTSSSASGNGSQCSSKKHSLALGNNPLQTNVATSSPVYVLPCNSAELPCMLALIEYAYTGRLKIERCQVRTLYTLATRMRMPAVAQHCSQYLLSTLNVNNCLALRATSGLRQDPPLLCSVDTFIRQHSTEILGSSSAQRLPRVQLDLLHSGRKPAQCVNRGRLFDLALHWMRQQMQQKHIKVDTLTSRSFMLYLDKLDQRLHDCAQLSKKDVQYSEAVHEYQCLIHRQCPQIGCSTTTITEDLIKRNDSNSSLNGSVTTHVNESTDLPRNDSNGSFTMKTNGSSERNSIINELNRSFGASGRSQDLHTLLDTEEDRADLPGIADLEDQWALQSATNNGQSVHYSVQRFHSVDNVIKTIPQNNRKLNNVDIDSDLQRSDSDLGNSRASSKPCLLTRSDSSSSLSSLPDEENESDWKLLTSLCLSKSTLVCLAMAAGRLCMIHIRLRAVQEEQSTEAFGPSASANVSVNELGDNQIVDHDSKINGLPTTTKKSHYIPIAPIPRGRCALGVAALNDSLVICGGYDRSECLRSVDRYDPVNNSWTSCAPMRVQRGRFSVAVVQNQIFAIGGSDGQKELSSAEKFNQDTWSFIASCPVERSNAGVCALDGKVYVIGGWNGHRGMQRCDTYDPVLDAWSRIADLNVGRSQVAVAVLGGEIYAVGGAQDAWACLNSVEKLDKDSGSWKLISPLHVARRGCGLAEFQGQLCAVGGHDGRSSLNSTERYDPTTGTWNRGPSLSVGRANVAVAVVLGRLFAVGGFSGKHFLHSIEYLEKVDGEWSGFVRDNYRESHQEAFTS